MGTNTFINVTVQEFIESLNLHGTPNDVSKLSALAYLPSDSRNPFESTAVSSAVGKVTGSGHPVNTSAGVNAAVRDAIVVHILSLENVSSQTLEISAIIDTVFKAGRDGFLTALIQRIRAQTGNAPSMTRIIDPSTANYSLQDLFGFIQKNVSDALPILKPDGTRETNRQVWETAVREIVKNTIREKMPVVEQAAFIFDKPTLDAMIELGLGPWLTMQFMISFNLSPDMSFFTQVYARYAVAKAAAISINSLANTYDNTAISHPKGQSLRTIAVNINAIFDTSIGDYTNEVMSVMESSKLTKTNSAALSRNNTALSARVGLTQDLQVSYQVDARVVAARRRAFYAWIFALIVVVGASAFLIATGRLSAYLMLAASTTVVLFLYVIFAMVRPESI